MGSSRRRSGRPRPKHDTAMHAPRRAASTRLKRGYKATFVQKTALWTASGPLWRTNRRRSARASAHRSRTRPGSTEPSPTGRCDSKTCRLDVPRPTDGTNADVWSRTTDAARARGGGLGYARTRLGSGRGRGGRKPPFRTTFGPCCLDGIGPLSTVQSGRLAGSCPSWLFSKLILQHFLFLLQTAATCPYC